MPQRSRPGRRQRPDVAVHPGPAEAGPAHRQHRPDGLR